MTSYLLRRLALLPLTLFAILTLNFLILNLAPADPRVQKGSSELQMEETQSSGLQEDPYSLFYQKFGLHLPVFLNLWIFESQQQVSDAIQKWQRQYGQDPSLQFSVEAREQLRLLKNKAAYQMPQLLALLDLGPHARSRLDPQELVLISQLLIEGTRRLAHTSVNLSASERRMNQEIAQEHAYTSQLLLEEPQQREKIVLAWRMHLRKRPDLMRYDEALWPQKILWSLQETRFMRYLGRMVQLDFGHLKSDPHRLVVREVLVRLPTSLALAILPMLLTIILSLLFALIMARFHQTPLDWGLNLLFLTLYATPVFVVGPWLIERIAENYPSWAPLPSSGFHSSYATYKNMNSFERLIDTLRHMVLPFITVIYGTWASKARLARTVMLEVMRQDCVMAARARGLSSYTIWKEYIIRPSAIPLVTALAGSLNIVMGGSLIVETLFEIDGFGKFFYEATIERDLNVMMFSTLLGALLTLTGYLLADLAYTHLDPRIKLDES